MARCALAQSGPQDGLPDGSLEDGLVDMVTALQAGSPIGPAVFLWENPLPAPLGSGVGVLPVESLGQEHPSMAFCEILPMNASYVLEMSVQQLHRGGR